MISGPILLFPMLSSPGISTNIIPGIAKTLEIFTMTYKMADVIKLVNKSSKIKLKIKGKKIISETELPKRIIVSDMIIGSQLNSLSEAGGSPALGSPYPSNQLQYGDDDDNIYLPSTTSSDFSSSDFSSSNSSSSSSKPQDVEKVTTADFSVPDMKSVSVQPTWVKVDTPKGSTMLGIKVVPIKFKDEDKVMKFLEDDYSRKVVMKFFVAWGRGIARKMWNIWYKTIGSVLSVFFGRSVATGDIKKDIILAKSLSKQNVFVLFNFMLLKEKILDDSEKISSLFSQKWSSIIVADDQNKIVYFCMKEFSGICSMIPYTLIYASLGKESYKAFDDLEDARKTSSALFTRKLPKQKLLKSKLKK